MNHFPYAHAASSSSGPAVLFCSRRWRPDDRAEVSSALEKLQKLRRARGPLSVGEGLAAVGRLFESDSWSTRSAALAALECLDAASMERLVGSVLLRLLVGDGVDWGVQTAAIEALEKMSLIVSLNAEVIDAIVRTLVADRTSWEVRRGMLRVLATCEPQALAVHSQTLAMRVLRDADYADPRLRPRPAVDAAARARARRAQRLGPRPRGRAAAGPVPSDVNP